MNYDKLIEDMRKIVDKNSISIYKRGKCADTATVADAVIAIETLRTDLARTMKERNAAIQYLREFDVCAGCKYFKDGVCRNDKSSLCTDENDLYEFAMPEDSNVC